MIKGILALFNLGLIYNPMVLLGIITGFVAMGALESEQLHALYTNYHLYLLMLLIAGLYVYFFRRTFMQNGYDTDWKATIQTMVGHFLMLVVSFLLSMLFVMSISFGGMEEEVDYDELPGFTEVEQDIKNHQKELQENYDAIMKAIDMPAM